MSHGIPGDDNPRRPKPTGRMMSRVGVVCFSFGDVLVGIVLSFSVLVVQGAVARAREGNT